MTSKRPTRRDILTGLLGLLALCPLAGWASDDGALGPLSLDSRGADFREWINHFKAQLYSNWPPPGQTTSRGRVVLEFVVARDGTLQRVRVKESKGDKAVGTAAEAALRSSAFLPLPADYKRASIKMQLAFFLGDQ